MFIADRIKKRYSAADRRKFPFAYGLLVLPVAYLAVFWFYVNVSSVALAFQDESGAFTFEWFRFVWKGLQGGDKWGFSLLPMFGKSLLIWFLNQILCSGISLFTCYMLTKHMIASKFIRLVFYIPGLVGGVVFTSIMKNMYAYDGLVTSVLTKIGVNLPPLALRFGLLGAEQTAVPTLLTQLVIFGIGGGNMIIAGAFLRIPEELFESAKLDGAGFFREIFNIAIPCAWPTISTILTFGLCSLLTSDYSFYLYSNGSGNNGMQSIGFYLYYMQVSMADGNARNWYGYLSALGVCITVVTVPLVLLGRKFLSKINDAVGF